jgi:hypothetical protein
MLRGQVQLGCLADEVNAEAVVRLLLHELEAAREVDAEPAPMSRSAPGRHPAFAVR